MPCTQHSTPLDALAVGINVQVFPLICHPTQFKWLLLFKVLSKYLNKSDFILMPDFIKLTELLSHVINSHSLSLTLLMSNNLKAQSTPWRDWQNSRSPVDAVAFPSCQQSKINILSCKPKLSCPAVPNKQTWAFSDISWCMRRNKTATRLSKQS